MNDKNMELVWSAFGQLPQEARTIRAEVFVNEQGFQEEFDEIDGKSRHVVLYLNGQPAGTARIFWDEKTIMRLGRLALHKSARGGGYGRAVLDACREEARRAGAVRMVLDAQKRAKGFYEACGFVTVGEEFLEEDYPHFRMECSLV
ncbi:MAG: GNAT family N-acetyltransferase [Intestinibacillus sp.]